MEKIDWTDRIEHAFNTVGEGKIYRSVIDSAERLIIEKALFKTGGNQILAARILGLNRNTLRAKVKRLKIDPAQFKQ
jgi:two-component system nitrogen regulation response regulator GlnG